MVEKSRIKDKNGNGLVEPGNVYNYLKEKGVSHTHALGIMANLNSESGWNHSAVGDSGNAIGLFQHNGPRKAALLKYVNGDTSNWKKQIDFALQEKGSSTYLNKQFSNAESAGEYFMKNWERPKNQSDAAVSERLSWLKTWGGGKYADPNYVPTSSASISSTDYDTTPGVSTGLAQEFLVSNPQDYHQKAAEFKKELAIEKEKAKKIETDEATKELTAAQIEHNKRIEFLNIFNTPKEASATTPIQDQPQEVGEDLYTQNLGFDLQDTRAPLFKTRLDIPEPTQEFGDGGRKQSLSDLTINEEYHYQGRPTKAYKLNDNGQWLIKDTLKKDDKWIPIIDPTGERAATLERSVIPKTEYLNNRQESIQKELAVIKGQNNKFYLPDTRTIRATTGKPINPNVDLMAGEYSEDVVKEIITKAREKGVDPKTALAIALQESQFGKKDPNLGHSSIGDTDPYGYMDILKSKIGLAKSKGHDDEYKQIQFYNGTGKLFPHTEAGYHGFTAGKFYGVPVTEAGLDMMQNPLYGKQIVDLRDNVIGKSEHIDSLLNVKHFDEGGKLGDGQYTHSGHNYKKIDGKWYIEPVENSGEYKLIEKGDVKSRIAELEKNATAYTTKGPKSNLEWADKIELSNNSAIGDMLGVPQAMATSALTDNKYTLPSQWLEGEGYSSNPVVGGIADFVLDPMNLLMVKAPTPRINLSKTGATLKGDRALKAWNTVVDPISKFDMISKPTTNSYREGGKKDKPENYKILPETFNYEGRPGARYRRDNYGNWLVADRNTNGEFVAVKDATGVRQAELNRRAISSETGKTVNEYAKKEAKDPQKKFEQEAWNDYDKLSTSEKVLDRVKAAMVDPIGMTSRFITGDQAYIPGMGNGLLNTESENYDKYLKSVGYTQGKFEASDLQNILNPMYWGASAGNQLDKGNTAQGVLEAGLAFAGAGQGKNMLQGVKYLADDVTKGSKALKNVSIPTYQNVYRVEPTTFVKDAADELSGRWMGSLEEMPYYVRNLKDPEAGIRIIRQKMPTKSWEAISGHNMPDKAKLMSAGTGDYKTFQEAVNAGEISRDAGSRISQNAYTTSDMAELSNNPRLINLTEGIISDELANKLRYEQPRRFFPTRDLVEYPTGDLGKEGAMDHIFNVRGDVEKPILGIPRKYFPFREGGTQDLSTLLDIDKLEEFRNRYNSKQ